MAKTYEAMMKAEEEAQKKQAESGLSPVDRRPDSIDSGLSTESRGLPSASARGPSTVDRGKVSTDRGLPFDSDEYYRLKQNILRSSENGKIKSLLFLSPTGGRAHQRSWSNLPRLSPAREKRYC